MRGGLILMQVLSHRICLKHLLNMRLLIELSSSASLRRILRPVNVVVQDSGRSQESALQR